MKGIAGNDVKKLQIGYRRIKRKAFLLGGWKIVKQKTNGLFIFMFIVLFLQIVTVIIQLITGSDLMIIANGGLFVLILILDIFA